MAELAVTHAALQKAITDLCGYMGIWWWHDTDSRKNKAGLPDLLLVGGHGAMWRELKVPPDDLTQDQALTAARFLRAGWSCDVWRPDDWRSGRIRAELEAIR